MKRRDGLLADAAAGALCSPLAWSQPKAAPVGRGRKATAAEVLLNPDIVEAQAAPKSSPK